MSGNKEYQCPKCGSLNTGLDCDYPILDSYPAAVYKCNDCSERFGVLLYD